MVGKILRTMRRKNNLSQEQIGKLTGYAKNTISPEFCNAHYCELYFSPLYKRVLLCQEIFIFVLYNLVQ